MYKVLVVDDKEVFRRKIKRMHYFQDNKEKFEICDEAQSGIEALELLHCKAIDVVLTDIRMPFMDGIQLLKQINAEELCNCVILLSEFAEFSYAKEGILNRAFDYIVKPVDEEKISISFDRAYTYLNSFANAKPTFEKRKIHALAEAIFANKAVLIERYTSHIIEYAQRISVQTEPQEILEDIYIQLKMELLRKWPFLEYYIPFDNYLRNALSCFKPDDFNKITMKLIQTLASDASIFSPILAAGNENVRTACIQILFSPDENFNFKVLSNQMFIDSKYLSALIKKDIGMTAVELVTFIKVQRAKFFLFGTDLSVSEISQKLGYQEVNYFSRVFKKSTMLSPREFRKAFGNNDSTEL